MKARKPAKKSDPKKVTDAMRETFLLAQHCQESYWDALTALELAIGREIDGTADLNETDVETLLQGQRGAV